MLLNRAKKRATTAHDKGMPHILVVSEGCLQRVILQATRAAQAGATGVSVVSDHGVLRTPKQRQPEYLLPEAQADMSLYCKTFQTCTNR